MYDVIVVGGGYIGTAVSYVLSKAGLKTLLIEQNEIGVYASGANFGCIQVQDANLGESLEMTLEGFRRAMNLEQELGTSLDLNYEPSLIVAENDAEMQELESLYKGKKEAGLDISLLLPIQIKEREPHLNTDILLGASYYVQGGLNPFKLLYGFVGKAKSFGLTVQEHMRVVSFFEETGVIKGVVLQNDVVIRAEHVVLATGAFTKNLGMTLGLDIPVEYIKGEAMVTEPIRPMINTYISSAAFFSDSHDEAGGCSVCIHQTINGNILIGETSSPGPVDPLEMNPFPTKRQILELGKKARRYFSFIKDLSALRFWSTPSPYTLDFNPILGAYGKKGLYVAAGFKSCVVMTLVAGERIKKAIFES